MNYSIGEMARIIGVAPSTLRYYDREGLLPFVERTDGGIRVFQDKDIAALRLIQCLRRAFPSAASANSSRFPTTARKRSNAALRSSRSRRRRFPRK